VKRALKISGIVLGVLVLVMNVAIYGWVLHRWRRAADRPRPSS